MVAKQLIVAVEGTAAIGPFWQTIVSDYLYTIVRCFCGNESMGQNPSTPQVELSLVVFNAHGPYSACVVQRSGWTRDMNLLFHWLSVIPFAGGGFFDAAIAEGLAEALMMFSSSNGNQNQNMDAQRHCILVAASNPYTLPTPVYQPQPPRTEESNNIETPTENRLSDAEALAKLFAQRDISLSVICPKKLPKLKAIYNAIARERRKGNSNPQLADPPGDNNAKNPHFLVLISDNFMEARAALHRSGILNLKSNQNPVKMDATPSDPAPPNSGPLLASVSSGVTSIAGSLPIPATGQVAPNSASASFTSAVSTVTGNSSLSMSQPISNLQVSGSLGHTLPGMSQGNLPTTQMVQTGTGMNPNITSGPGTSGMPSGNGTMMPTPGMSQPMHPGMQPIGMNGNSSVTNIALNQQTSSHSKYVKVWEGNLCGQRQGQPVFITRLEGYRKNSACETLAENWPLTIQIVRLISQNHMNNKQYVGKADFLVFRAMDQHGFLGQLQERKLCAVIQLPSQTLLLSVSDKAYRLIGMLFPGALFFQDKPQVPNPQQQQQQQQQQMQQQQRPAHAVLQQQQLLQQQPQPMAQQQIPQLQQQMAGMVVNQAYMQGPGRPQLH